MMIVFPVCHKDVDLCSNMLRWCAELGSYVGHRALIVGSATLTTDTVTELVQLARNVKFGTVDAIRATTEDTRPWPYGPNLLFRTTAQYMEQKVGPWLWMEPDVSPIAPSWADDIQKEYLNAAKPFLGCVWGNGVNPPRHLTGVAVYPSRVRTFNPNMLCETHLPFDCVRPEKTLRHTQQSRCIQHSWGDIATNTAPTFPDRESLSQLRDGAVIFHRCKDGSLIERLREQKNHVATHKPKPSIFTGIRRKVKALLRCGSTYYHSGNLGDIIYSLYAIKEYGGGDLILGPKQNRTSPCAVPITKEQFDLFLPLLKEQKYLRHIEFSPDYPKDRFQFDLNTFRNHWHDWPMRQRENIHTLCKAHFHALGITHRFNEDEAWLYCPDPIFHGQIVVHRSARYRSNDFPWQKLVDRFSSRMLFVGHEAEWRQFCVDYKTNLDFWRVRDFLQLARLIAGAKYFIGNQSFPLSLAIGMRQRVLCEEWLPSPDCRFERDCYASQNKGIEKIERWL